MVGRAIGPLLFCFPPASAVLYNQLMITARPSPAMESEDSTPPGDLRLRRVSPAMFSSVHSLLETSFFPCSPLSSSLGLSQTTQFWTWAWVRSLLLEETGLVALDSEDEVVGVLLGKHSLLMDLTATERLVDFIFGGGWEEFLGEGIWRLCWYLNFMLPSYYADHTYGLFRDIEQRLGYEENKIMTELNCDKVRGSGSGGLYWSSVLPL